jgi:serine phosphatase RsbU (regulator of sigma subunit)
MIQLAGTLFLGVLNIETGDAFSQCRQRSAIPGSQRHYFKAGPNGPLVGVLDNVDYFTEFPLEHKDYLVIYSDGILDAQNPSGEMYEKGRWQSLLVQTAPEGESFTRFLSRSVNTFIGDAAQYDDISLLVLTRK